MKALPDGIADYVILYCFLIKRFNNHFIKD